MKYLLLFPLLPAVLLTCCDDSSAPPAPRDGVHQKVNSEPTFDGHQPRPALEANSNDRAELEFKRVVSGHKLPRQRLTRHPAYLVGRIPVKAMERSRSLNTQLTGSKLHDIPGQAPQWLPEPFVMQSCPAAFAAISGSRGPGRRMLRAL